VSKQNFQELCEEIKYNTKGYDEELRWIKEQLGDIDVTRKALEGGPGKLSVVASEETKALLLSLVQKQIEDFKSSLNAAYFTPIAEKAVGQQVQPLQYQQSTTSQLGFQHSKGQLTPTYKM
jgi:hypothetical protein